MKSIYKMILRPALCLVMALVLLLGAVPAGAAEQEAAAQNTDTDTYYQLAEQLTKTLGIDTYFTPGEGDSMTYAVFAYTLAAAAGMEVTAAADIQCVDSVSKNHWAARAVQSLFERNYLSRLSKFSADAPISYEDAMILGVSAAGYRVKAEAQGGTKAAYRRIASDLKFDDGITAEGDLSFRDGAVLLYRILSADMLQLRVLGEKKTYDTVPGESLLTVYHRIREVRGIVTATPYSGLSGTDDTLQSDTFRIDDRNFSADKPDPALLGRNVIALYREGDTKDEILAAVPYQNRSVTFCGDDIDEFAGQKISVYEEDAKKPKKYTLLRGYDFIFNGRALPQHSGVDITTLETEITLVDNNDDNVYDVIWVEQTDYFVVQSANDMEREIYDQYTGKTLKLGEQDAEIRAVDESGESVYWQQYSQGDVLAVKAAQDNMFVDIRPVNGSVSGSVTALRTEESEIEIDGKTYQASAYLLANFPIKLGMNAVFVSDNGRLVSLTLGNNAMSYGFLIQSAVDPGFSRTVRVRMLTQSGKIQELTLADKIYLDDNGRVPSDENLVLNAVGTPQLVRYQLDGEGKIRRLDTAEIADAGSTAIGEEKEPYNSLTRYTYTTPPTWRGNARMLFPYANIGSSVIFVVPTDPNGSKSQDDAYAVVTCSDLNLYYGTSYPMEIYDLNQAGSAGALVYRSDSAFDSNVNNRSSAVVDYVAEREGGYHEIHMIIDGVYTSYLAAEDVSIEKPSGEILSRGDIIRFLTYPNGEIRSITVDYDGTDGPVNGVIFNASTSNHEAGYHMGRIYSVAGGYLYLSKTSNPQETANFSWGSLYNFSMPGDIVVVDTKRDNIRIGTQNEVKTFRSDEPSFVVLRHNNHFQGRLLVVYE